MKLAIDCRFIGKSGIGTYIENILDELVAHHPEHDYWLIAEKPLTQYVSFPNIKYILTDIKPFSLRELLMFPVGDIHRCDAYFTPYINIPVGIKAPVYSTIHDVIFLDLPELTSRIGRMVRWFFLWRATKVSKTIFTVSKFSKGRILAHFPNTKGIKIVNNCISKEIKKYDVTQNTKKDYFIFVGNIKAHKGLTTLLKGYEMAQQRGLKSKLLIVGSSEKFRTSDTELTTLLNKVNNVEFTGWVDDNRLCELIASAKALVLPSRYEGFGIPPMEALFLGTNAIVSDIPVLKEVYSKYPVTFFNVDNPESLCDALLQQRPDIDMSVIRNAINRDYDIKEEVEKILKIVEGVHEREY